MKNSRKKLFFTLLSIVILLLLSYIIVKYLVNPTDNMQDKVSVRMKWFYSGTMTGWFAGKEQGIFKKNGIEITINSGGPDNSAIKLVASGVDLFGVSGADEVLIAREKGIPIVPIAVLFKESPIGFISKKEKNITSPKDWKDKIIEVDYGSNAEIQYRAILKKMSIKDVKEVPYTYSLIPFIENKVDVSVAYIMDQVVTLQNRGIDLNISTAKEYGINPYGDVIFTTEKTLKENPNLVKRFINAVKESHIWSIQNVDTAVNALILNVPTLKISNEIQVWKATIPFLLAEDGVHELGNMKENRWEETQNILIEFGALKNKSNLKF